MTCSWGGFSSAAPSLAPPACRRASTATATRYANFKEMVDTTGLFVVGLAAPGGGYATAGKALARAVKTACSFNGETRVATAGGRQAISDLNVGEQASTGHSGCIISRLLRHTPST